MTFEQFCNELTELWAHSRQVSDVPPEIEADFYPGYTSACHAIAAAAGVEFFHDAQGMLHFYVPKTEEQEALDTKPLIDIFSGCLHELACKELDHLKTYGSSSVPGHFLGRRRAFTEIAKSLGLAHNLGMERALPYGFPSDQGIRGFAGPQSTWFLHTATRALFDAGETLTSHMKNKVFFPDALFLTHAHLDHVAGLPSFLMARQMMRGDTGKPFDVYFPDGAEEMLEPIRQCAERLLDDRAGSVQWLRLSRGDRVAMRHWIVEPFEAIHDVPAFGYRVLEQRKRLKVEYHDVDKGEIQRLRAQGTELTEIYEHVTFAITGDTGPGLEPSLVSNADYLLHESTFLDEKDRRGHFHATTREAFDLAASANVKNLVLYHFSQRYSEVEIKTVVEHHIHNHAFDGKVFYVAGFTDYWSWY